jgi:hypothetical protein
MPFIGTQPRAGAYSVLDSITVTATDTFNLTLDGAAYYPQSANHLIVSINGTMQAPINSFTISGSQIIFSENLLATDVIDFILALGDTLSIGVPSDGTITTSKMVDSAVTTSKIANNSVTSDILHTTLDLSGKTVTYGNLPAANLTGSLPAIDGSALTGIDALPSQTGSNGYFLTTDGSTASWAEVDALPSQTGNNGYYLTTDGSTASWAELSVGASAGGVIWENSTVISSNYTLSTGKNGFSVGPVTVNAGVSVTVPSGQKWVVL